MSRKARLHGIFGDTNSGKSHYVLKVLIPHFQRHHPELKQLVIASEDHPDYAAMNYQIIEPEMLKRWTKPQPGSVKRIIVNPADTDSIDEVFMLMHQYLPNAVVYAEDAGGFLPDNLKNCPGVIAFVGSAKNQNRECFFQFWAFSEVPRRMCGWFKSMVIFTTRDVTWDPENNKIIWSGVTKEKLGSAFFKIKGPYERILKLKMQALKMNLPVEDPRMHPKEIVFVT